jgi:hypothetical protein
MLACSFYQNRSVTLSKAATFPLTSRHITSIPLPLSTASTVGLANPGEFRARNILLVKGVWSAAFTSPDKCVLQQFQFQTSFLKMRIFIGTSSFSAIVIQLTHHANVIQAPGDFMLIRDRLSGWGARLSAGALPCSIPNVIVWQTPTQYEPRLGAGGVYLALAAVMLDLIVG